MDKIYPNLNVCTSCNIICRSGELLRLHRQYNEKCRPKHITVVDKENASNMQSLYEVMSRTCEICGKICRCGELLKIHKKNKHNNF
jgi:hypothetical protein